MGEFVKRYMGGAELIGYPRGCSEAHEACFAVRSVTKPLLLALCDVFAFGGLRPQKRVWQPSGAQSCQWQG
jgi:hypothetical protein